VVGQFLYSDIKISNEDKCISLLYSILDSWDNMVVSIGSSKNNLKFDEIVSSLLSEGDETKKYGEPEWRWFVCERTIPKYKQK